MPSTLENDMDAITAILDRTRTIAVVGLSTNPAKTAHQVPAAMQRMGFRVIGVHPTAQELLGERAYPTLADIPEPVDLVNVFRPSAEAIDVVRQAVAIGAPAVWLQQGIASAEGRMLARDAGMGYVENRCIMVEARSRGLRQAS